MRHVQFAQHFAQQFGKIVVVVDVRQEFAVVGCHLFPVYAVHALVVEVAVFLTANVVEHVFAFFCQVKVHICIIADAFQFFAGYAHFLECAAEDEEVVAVLVQLKACP